MSFWRWPDWRAHRVLRALGAGVIVAAIACLVRFLWVEPLAVGLLCQVEAPPWWCVLRRGLGAAFHLRVFGALAIFLAIAAHVVPGREATLGFYALLAGVLAMVFYNALGGAVGLIGGLLALVAVEYESGLPPSPVRLVR
ncbi:MAG: hypothetical protein HQL66_11330 [Magnetococcales bacterium]|nr:hypothetical protein [Magnetococcales bacterium]